MIFLINHTFHFVNIENPLNDRQLSMPSESLVTHGFLTANCSLDSVLLVSISSLAEIFLFFSFPHQPETFGLQVGRGCVPCNCNSFGSKSFDCEESGQCWCQPGVAGKKCDRCAHGYFNFQEGGCTGLWMKLLSWAFFLEFMPLVLVTVCSVKESAGWKQVCDAEYLM